jgi:hypothetical protein
VLGELISYLKLGEGLAYVHRLPADPNYRDTIGNLFRDRAANFLGMVKLLLSDAAHPYTRLFRLAGCTYADLEAEVGRRGLEDTLRSLLAEGVYLTLDEFRGNTEIVRGGLHIRSSLADWENTAGCGPLLNVSSGSSSGKSLKTMHSLEYFKFRIACGRIMRDELRDGPRAAITMLSILPSSIGLAGCLSATKLGYRSGRWFALGGGGSLRKNLHYKVLTSAIVARLRLAGAGVPYPTYLAPDDFVPVAAFIAERKAAGVPATIVGMVSSTSRVAAAALDAGLDIRGTFALVTGESLTDVKRNVIEQAGIEVYPLYSTSEFGGIGMPCRQMRAGNCVHITLAGLALVSRRQETWGDEDGEALHITSLLPYAPHMLINVETGDTGVIERTTCDCEFSRLGYDFQVRDIAATSKLRGQGYTLSAPEVIRLLEEGLARKFGGIPGDYQLLEVEGKAQTEMVLRIHPRANVASPQQVFAYFLDKCRHTYGGSLAVLHWTESKGIRVEVAPPILAASGKFRAVRLLGAGVSRTAPAAVIADSEAT